jgi:protease-4
MGLEAKLIDRIEYEDEFVARIKQRDGTRHPLVDYAAYARPRLVSAVAFADRIAVIYGVGAIQRGEGGFDPMSPEAGSMGSDEIVRAFRRARNDDSVRAVVFRVNSPGGSALASELIRRQVKLTADKKPVVVSMSGYAASGGYWIVAPAQKIFAEPGTITGSIGVLGGKFNVAPAAEKVRLNSGIVKRGENVSMFDMFSDFTPEQARLFHDRYISDTYQNFLKIVSEGRNMPVAEVDKIAQGRVWTGEQALGLKLIDGIGGLNEAIAEARALAKIAPDAEIALVELPQPPSVLQRLARGPLGGQQSWEDAAAFRAFGPLWNILRAALDADGVFSAVYCTVVPIL